MTVLSLGHGAFEMIFDLVHRLVPEVLELPLPRLRERNNLKEQMSS